MPFQPGNKLGNGRPKGSVRKKGVKQMKDALAADDFDIAAEVKKLLDDKTLDPAVRLKTLQFIAQYTQKQPTEQDFITQDEAEQTTSNAATQDLVALVKS